MYKEVEPNPPPFNRKATQHESVVWLILLVLTQRDAQMDLQDPTQTAQSRVAPVHAFC